MRKSGLIGMLGVTIFDILMLTPPTHSLTSIDGGKSYNDTNFRYFTIPQGTNLTHIARAFNRHFKGYEEITVESILKYNPDIKNPNVIYAGGVLRILLSPKAMPSNQHPHAPMGICG